MRLSIHVQLEYLMSEPTDLLLQVEAAHLPEQQVEHGHLELSAVDHFARMSAQDAVGERVWLRTGGTLAVNYRATVRIERRLADLPSLAQVPAHQLPGETVPYLFESRYCPSIQFENFVHDTFAGLSGGVLVAAMRDFIHDNFTYRAGASTAETTALESFVRREGVCRDYAHVLIAMARAATIPARIASVYAPRVDPPDFHAVAEVFLGGEWHLVDATGMADEGEIAKIGIGRDAADVAFLTAFGRAQMVAQAIVVTDAG